MQNVARFTTATEAMHFAAYLRAAGVTDVQVFEKGDPLGGVLGIDVAVREDDLARAEALKTEYDGGEPGQGEPPPAPDLSRLPTSLAPACPGCGAVLPLENLAACPACGAAVDVPDLIVRAHGPESLQVCYDRPVLTDEEAVSLAVHCAGCQYTLLGLPARGYCPECGLKFDKRSAQQSW